MSRLCGGFQCAEFYVFIHTYIQYVHIIHGLKQKQPISQYLVLKHVNAPPTAYARPNESQSALP